MDTVQNNSTLTYLAPGARMSQGVVHGGLLYTAGQVDASSPDVADQTTAILAKIDRLLAEAGSSKSKVITASIWLSDMASFDEMNPVWEGWIDKSAPPARATVESKLATPDYKIEISVIAVVGG